MADVAEKLHYPSWRHHEDGRERIVNTPEEDAALGAGWHRSADPATWAGELPLGQLPSAESADAQTAASVSDYVPLAYPSWRHHEDGRERIVETLEEDQALGREGGWHRSANPAEWQGEAPLGSVAEGQQNAPPATGPSDAEEQDACNELWNTPVPKVLDAIEEVTDVEQLKRVRAREVLNPKSPGGRRGIVGEIDEMLARLAPPTE